MAPIRVMVADQNEAFRENLAELLRVHFTVHTTGDGREALALLDSFVPDILVMDLMLPNIDGFYLLEQVRMRQNPPEVYVISGFLAVAIQERLLTMGVYGMLRKPCDLLQAEGNIRAVAQRLPVRIQQQETNAVAGTLLRLGFQSHWDGYSQLLRIIPMFARNPRQPLNKVIYTAVGKELGLSGEKPVERSVRAAIVQAWGRGDLLLWNHLFPPETAKNNKAPSNKQFIARVCEYLQREQYTR